MFDAPTGVASNDLECHPMTQTTAPTQVKSILELKNFLDQVHIQHCLLTPYREGERYPLVESRELLPSFECDVFEYDHLPGFSLVALRRPINYFQEIFQFDILHSLMQQGEGAAGMTCPLEGTVLHENIQTLLSRLPKQLQDSFRGRFTGRDITDLDEYDAMFPYLLQLDRAHVLTTDIESNFALSGIYASFPSDLDAEIKRFGLRIKKFRLNDNAMYERNRIFVYQFLMELYGFPIVSERRTSAALFSRRLFRMGEEFLIRVLGQSDRTITTLFADPSSRFYPRIEKIALVRVEKEQKDVIDRLSEGGFFVDPENRVVILRVRYRQHKYNPGNVRQDRALSVESQEVIHPVSGLVCPNLNIIKDTYNMFLRLNDIIRGEYEGRIVFKRNEIVENTNTDEKRLKFLYSWLSKHQRRIVGYTDDFYAKVSMILDNYLLNPNNFTEFEEHHDLYQEVWSKYSYIQQARKVKRLEDLVARSGKHEKTPYLETLQAVTELLQELKFEIVYYFEDLVLNTLHICDRILGDSYLKRAYVEKRSRDLSEYGMEVKKHYGKIVTLMDEFRSIRKSRGEHSDVAVPHRPA